MNQQSSPSYYRTVARNALRNHWGKAVGITLLGYMLPSSVVNLILQPGLYSIERATQAGDAYIQEHLASFIAGSIGLGILCICLGIVLGATQLAIMLGYGDKQVLGNGISSLTGQQDNSIPWYRCIMPFAFYGFLLPSLLLLLLIIIIAIPIALIIVSHPDAVLAVSLFCVFLFIILVGIYFIYTYAVMLYPLFYKDHRHSMSAFAVWKYTIRQMRGHKMDLFVLGLSFIGWFLLAILTLGIGLLWVVPYQFTAYAAFYEDRFATHADGEPSTAPAPAPAARMVAAHEPRLSSEPHPIARGTAISPTVKPTYVKPVLRDFPDESPDRYKPALD